MRSEIAFTVTNRLVFLLMLGLAACAPDRSAGPDTGPKIYEAFGTIVSIEGEYVLIDHDDIPGFMDAMTMTFPVSDPSLLEGFDKGARVSFRVVVDGASYRIDRIESVARVESPPER